MRIKLDNLYIKIILIFLLIFFAKLSGSLIVMSSIAALLLVIALSSKNNLLWYFLSILYASNPMGLFKPYTFGLNIGFTTLDFSLLLLLILFFKTINKKRNYNFYNTNTKFLLIILLILNILNGLIVGIGSVQELFRTVKLLIPWLAIPLGLKIIDKEDDFYSFFKLGAFVVFVSFLAQITVYYLGVELSHFLFGAEISSKYEGRTIDVNDHLSRIVYAVYLCGIVIIGMFTILYKQQVKINFLYYGMIFLGLLSVVMSGTRAWSIAYIVLTVIIIIKSAQFVLRRFISLSIGVIIVLFLLSYIPFISKQFNMSLDRILTVEKLAEGDLTAGGTAERFDVRGPKVLDAFFETNIVFGAGFSNYNYENTEAHVGLHSLLLEGGVIGFIIVQGVLIFVIINLIMLSIKSKRPEFLYIAALLIAWELVNTSKTTFVVLTSPDTGTAISFIFVYISFLYHTNYNNVRQIQNTSTIS